MTQTEVNSKLLNIANELYQVAFSNNLLDEFYTNEEELQNLRRVSNWDNEEVVWQE